YREFPSPAAASRILWSRGVAGILVNPFPAATVSSWAREFEWDRFSVVKLTNSAPELRFHVVRLSAFDYIATAIEEMIAKGYRRIGVLMSSSSSPRDDDARFGALLNYQHRRVVKGET